MSNLNGHYNTHDVIATDHAHGERIRGKLSDFKGELRHLWSDTNTTPNKKGSALVVEGERPGFITVKEAAEWFENHHNTKDGLKRIEGYRHTGRITTYYANEKRTKVRISVAELESLVVKKSGELIPKKRERHNIKLSNIAYELGLTTAALKEKVDSGELTMRDYHGKMVYYFSDVKKLFGIEGAI